MYNVMIVDDELWFRTYLKELIDQSGSEFLVCAQAANGTEALKILAAQPVDVVIADVLMPVMDGVELMQHLSDLPHRLPVSRSAPPCPATFWPSTSPPVRP